MQQRLLIILIIFLIASGLFLFIRESRAQTETPTLEEISQEVAKQLPEVKVLPGQAFYFLKTIKEKIEIFTTYGAKNQAKLFLKFVNIRLAEYQALQAQGKERLAERALEMYTKQLDQAIKKLTEAEKKESLEEVADDMVQITEKHLQVLHLLYEKVPEPAKAGLQRALEASQRGVQIAKEIVSGQRREEVQRKTKEVEEKTEKGIKGIMKKLWPI